MSKRTNGGIYDAQLEKDQIAYDMFDSTWEHVKIRRVIEKNDALTWVKSKYSGHRRKNKCNTFRIKIRI